MMLSSCLVDVTLFFVVVETMLIGGTVMFVCVIGVVTFVTIATLVTFGKMFVVTWLLFELLVMEVVVAKFSWTEESSVIWEISSVVFYRG